MQNTTYLIVGGGMTAAAAVEGIREHDADGAITLVGAEPHPPYKRPPLSKKLWSGGDEAKIWNGTDERGADLVARPADRRRSTSTRAARPTTRATSTRYEKVLLATGGAPRRLGGDDGEVVYFRTLDDYRALRAARATGRARRRDRRRLHRLRDRGRARRATGAKVTMVFPEPAIGVAAASRADLARVRHASTTARRASRC